MKVAAEFHAVPTRWLLPCFPPSLVAASGRQSKVTCGGFNPRYPTVENGLVARVATGRRRRPPQGRNMRRACVNRRRPD
jgi:hypothetical protein